MSTGNEKAPAGSEGQIYTGIEQCKDSKIINIPEGYNSNQSNNLRRVLSTNAKLKELKAQNIRFSEPILTQDSNPVLFPHTLNVIQGQAGAHKSRLAETICAAFLHIPGAPGQLLGYKRENYSLSHTVVYVDTERNLTEQLPFALQSIQTKAGYDKTDNPKNFEYISLLEIPRAERFTTLNEYLEHVRETIQTPLFVVLDVSTDCLADFNRTDQSMQLIDMMNITINQHDVIFLCLIHENPKSEKARGHFGTELMNKASTVMQVSFEKDASQNDTDLIRVKYLKCRTTKKHAPFHIVYSDEAKGLVLASPNMVSSLINNRKQKASNEDISEHLEMYLGDGVSMPRVELLDKLCADFKASIRTIETRINEILDSQAEIFNSAGESCFLTKSMKDKVLYYKLTKNESIAS
jgi:hypothetical protein